VGAGLFAEDFGVFGAEIVDGQPLQGREFVADIEGQEVLLCEGLGDRELEWTVSLVSEESSRPAEGDSERFFETRRAAEA
jgi:hypothetical protein